MPMHRILWAPQSRYRNKKLPFEPFLESELNRKAPTPRDHGTGALGGYWESSGDSRHGLKGIAGNG